MAFDIEGARKAGFSEEQIADYLAKMYDYNIAGARQAGFGNDKIIEHLMAMNAAESQGGQPAPTGQSQKGAPAEEKGLLARAWDATPRSLKLGMRDVLEGAGSIPQALINPALNTISGLTTGNYERFGNAGTALADKLGLPTAQTRGERLISAVNQGGVGAMTPLAPLSAAQKLGSLRPVASEVVSRMTEAPLMQGVSGATAGGGAELGNNPNSSPLWNTVRSTAFGMLGGAVPGAIPAVAQGGKTALRAIPETSRALSALTDEGQYRLAQRVLRNAAGDDWMKAAEAALEAPVYVEGAEPTLGQASLNPGLNSLERITESKGTVSGQFADRYQQQREARQNALNAIGEGAQQRLAAEREGLSSTLPEGESADTAGHSLLDAFKRNYNAEKERTRAAYDAIDPEGKAQFDMAPIYDTFDAELGTSPYARGNLPGDITKLMGEIGGDVASDTTRGWPDLQAIRTRLSDLEFKNSSVNGDPNTKRVAGNMKRDLDAYISGPGQKVFDDVSARAFKAAKHQRSVNQGAFERGSNRPLTGKGNEQNGMAITDAGAFNNYWKAGDKGPEAMASLTIADAGGHDMADALQRGIYGQLQSLAEKNGGVNPKWLSGWRQKYGQALKSPAVADVNRFTEDLLRNAKVTEGKVNGLRGALNKGQYSDDYKLRNGVSIDDRFGPSGSGTFTADELGRLRDVQADATRASKASALGSIAGSPTARNLQGAADIGGVISPLAARIPVISTLMSGPIQSADRRIWDIVTQSLLDPQRGAHIMLDGKGYANAPELKFSKGARRAARQARNWTFGGGLLGEFQKEERNKERKRREKK